jgi:phosphatidylinositol alpha 1,6-mannosyltransferase
LSRWYASGDIFVFPSTTETFANVVQEAMASGLPAVVSDRGGPPGVIEPELSGLVAAPTTRCPGRPGRTLLRDA